MSLLEKILPIALFIFVTSITPGPNNFMLATSGLQFGLRRTLPHIGGIFTGITVLMLMAVFGLNQLLLNLPGALLTLRLLGSAYLLYLAWKILGFSIATNHNKQTRPMTFVQAGLFQFANPKAWMASSAMVALALPLFDSLWVAIEVLLITRTTIGVGCNCLWVLSGVGLRHLLSQTRWRRIINLTLALLTAMTVGLFWIE